MTKRITERFDEIAAPFKAKLSSIETTEMWILTIAEPREGAHVLLFTELAEALAHVGKHFDASEGDLDAIEHGTTIEFDAETVSLKFTILKSWKLENF